MLVELFEGDFDRLGDTGRLLFENLTFCLGLSALLLLAGCGELFFDVLIQLAQDRHLDGLCVVLDRQVRDFDEARFDGFNQAEIGYDPLKKRVGLMT
ncbi:MAG: hypothetical protein BWY57_03337 [Betaproteobacteria bacterium ADurb.Bin341]|nr:MAG: hypothetical protein BWY57_03337 [Betaproteobacteria bacterium ADurb.Bin341]